MHDANPIPSDPLEPVFRALADPTRRAILDRLRVGRATTSDLAADFPHLTRFAVMKHLGVLEEADLVTSAREGRSRWNAINPVPLRRVYERWVSRYADLWAGPLLNLERLMEHDASPPGAHAMETTPARIAHLHAEITIREKPVAVFRAFAERTHEWFFADEKPGKHPIRMEPRLGGRLFEDRGAGHGITFATITHYLPHTRLAMSGEFCCNEACLSNVFFDFKETPEGHTTITMSHHMAGEFNDQYYEEFRVGWDQALESLRRMVERA